MKNKAIFSRIHWISWLFVTMITGILAGFLTSHSVLLGRYFTWILESGDYGVFTDSFALFREASQANVHYNYFLWASLVLGIFWTIFSFLVRKDRIVALSAGLSSFWVGCVFFASGFATAEEAVCSGTADAAARQFFVSWNLPMHASFAVFYTLCFLLLLIVGCKCGRKQEAQPSA
ncbi:MAG: hypothetical protein JW929_00785 [Anaerolineales bacterium]|nr:hypothetical protein [Anaerolineales bacterium]